MYCAAGRTKDKCGKETIVGLFGKELTYMQIKVQDEVMESVKEFI